jgi:hypothetical protein
MKSDANKKFQSLVGHLSCKYTVCAFHIVGLQRGEVSYIILFSFTKILLDAKKSLNTLREKRFLCKKVGIVLWIPFFSRGTVEVVHQAQDATNCYAQYAPTSSISIHSSIAFLKSSNETLPSPSESKYAKISFPCDASPLKMSAKSSNVRYSLSS